MLQRVILESEKHRRLDRSQKYCQNESITISKYQQFQNKSQLYLSISSIIRWMVDSSFLSTYHQGYLVASDEFSRLDQQEQENKFTVINLLANLQRSEQEEGLQVRDSYPFPLDNLVKIVSRLRSRSVIEAFLMLNLDFLRILTPQFYSHEFLVGLSQTMNIQVDTPPQKQSSEEANNINAALQECQFRSLEAVHSSFTDKSMVISLLQFLADFQQSDRCQILSKTLEVHHGLSKEDLPEKNARLTSNQNSKQQFVRKISTLIKQISLLFEEPLNMPQIESLLRSSNILEAQEYKLLYYLRKNDIKNALEIYKQMRAKDTQDTSIEALLVSRLNHRSLDEQERLVDLFGGLELTSRLNPYKNRGSIIQTVDNAEIKSTQLIATQVCV